MTLDKLDVRQKRCGAVSKKGAPSWSPHRCMRRKDHKGNHRCGVGRDKPCGYVWKRRRKS